MPLSTTDPLIWVGFTILVLGLLVMDLGVFHRKDKIVTFKEAAIWSCVWVSLALSFNLGLYFWLGKTKALEFFTGYLIELSLSVDNLFVFLVIFSTFALPRELMHRVLFWGIMGAMIMRAVFIGLGAALILNFHWVIYIFGAFLVVTGFKLLKQHEGEADVANSKALKLFRRFMPVTDEYHGKNFVIRRGGRLMATPLLAVLVVVEATDVMFALDSIPAIFAITRDPFIVYTSNIFAILGLRSMFFMLEGVMSRFYLLRYGLAFILIFVGTKMLIIDIYHIPIAVSLGVVAFGLFGSAIASLIWPQKESAATLSKD